ncbi:MAG TPA: hypothetical protein VMV31_04015 [Terriglobales bacterium]|nr:hypothetical protein [Terriglobales bacterium]
MWNSIKWWHESEGAETQIFRKSFWPLFCAAAAASACLALVPTLRAWYSVVILALGVGRALAERRRAFLFDAAGAAYRPAFGPPRRFAFADVVSVLPGDAPVPLLTRPLLVRGLHVRLRDGRELCLPLDFPRSELIAKLLTQAAPR